MRALFRIFVLLGCLCVAAIILFAVVHRDRRPRIYFAVESGDTNSIAQYLALGSNVNDAVVCYVYGHRFAPLLGIAARSGQPNAVDFLLRNGANPNLPDSSGDAPLICAIRRGQNEVDLRTMQLLLRAGANPDVRSSSRYGWTPLIHAAVLRCTDMIRILVAAGADVNATDADGATPLHYADNAEVAQCLIAAGANRNASFTYVTPADQDHPFPVTNTVTPADSAVRDKRFDVLAVLTNAQVQTNKP